MMFVLRSTMEEALEAERERQRERMTSMVSEYGKALSRCEALARQLAGWLSGKAENVTPQQMATLFWEWDETHQADFFNALQDVAQASADANPSIWSVGCPAGEAQWYHMVKKLNESGRETLEAMHDHLVFRQTQAA